MSLKIKNVTIGADPEMFLINENTGYAVSAIGLIPGEKHNPYTNGLPKGFGVERDCILAEFNIPPCKTRNEYVESIQYMKNWIRNHVKNENSELDIHCIASMPVPAQELRDPQANEIGCEVDFNVYLDGQNPKPNGYPSNMRVAGDHWHIGYANPNVETSLKLIKVFDIFCGVVSVLYDRDIFRRTLYGQAGSFRLTKYGVEARVLSSFMLNDQYLGMMYNQVMKAIDAVNHDMELPDPRLVQHCINSSDYELAQKLINEFKLCVE